MAVKKGLSTISKSFRARFLRLSIFGLPLLAELFISLQERIE